MMANKPNPDGYTLDDFTQGLIKALGEVPNEGVHDGHDREGDRDMVDQAILDLYTKGYSFHDALSWLLCLEHVDPEMEEDVALAKMTKINAKYKDISR